MAAVIQVPGPCLIKVSTGGPISSPTLETLGYTVNGADVTHEVMMDDIPGDQNGGDSGPPIDIQYYGQIARVRLEMSKWDTDVLHKLLPRVHPAGGVGAVVALSTATVGTLMAASGSAFRLLLLPTSAAANGPMVGPMNFLIAIPRGPIEVNKGSKWARLVLDFECHASEGVLANVTVV
jgi:hypothetical protein